MKIFIFAFFVSISLSSQLAYSDTDFANKHCHGNCANLLMASPDPTDPLSVDEQYLIQYYTETYNILDVSMFINAVSKIPSSEGTVYRGTQKKYTGANKPGQVIEFDRISSTSTDRYFAENFLGDQLLVIKAKSAKSISNYSVTNEQEHILLPGTQFRVDKITTEKIDLTNEVEQKIINVEVVYLTEL